MVNYLCKASVLVVTLLLGHLSQVHSVSLENRPNPKYSPWSDKTKPREAFENSPWDSVKAQQTSLEFDDNLELHSLNQSLSEAEQEFSSSTTESQQQPSQATAQVDSEQTANLEMSNDNQLTLVQAQIRASLISNVEYDVQLSLPKGASYFGQVAISFNLSKVPEPSEQPVFLDFFGTNVANLNINGKAVQADAASYFKGGMITLGSEYLQTGMNKISVYLINNYRNDGYGIHSFTDKVDMQQYLYTQFEPNYCHYLFPSFDQPDIKAKWSLSTMAPNDWAIISNENEDRAQTMAKSSLVLKSLQQVATTFNQSELIQKQVESKDHITVFRQSFKISPYLFAIVAGPYTFVESKTHGEGLPPMRVYLRKSVIKTVEPDILNEMLATTLVGMRFYKDLFGIPFQFRKYDQIFVPEFNSGAMENVACVTFSESELRRGQTMTLDEQLTLTNTLLHELAHQWFGNLVTMKWWNDLWLNESFATYMSYVVMTQAPELSTKYKGAWVDFMSMKFEGINADALNTTHPVVNAIQSVAEAESVFNGISYGKGASFLKQAMKVLGQDTMKKALHSYFQKYKWKNTEFSDFIGSLQEAYDTKNDTSMGQKFNFNQWCDEWLKNSGVNTLEPVVELHANESLSQMKIKQFIDPHGENRLRKSKIDIGIYDQNYQLHLIKDFVLSDINEMNNVTGNFLAQVNYNGPVKAVILNEGDHVYTKIRFDNNTLKSFKKDGLKIEDPLTRSLIWRNMMQQVLDLKLSSTEFFNFIVKNLPNEGNEGTLRDQMSNAGSIISYFLPIDTQSKSREQFFDAMMQIAEKPSTSQNLKEKIVEDIDRFIESETQSQTVVQWLEKGQAFVQDAQQTSLMNLTIGQKRNLLKGLCGLSSIQQVAKLSLMQQILGDDQSDESIETRIFCLAAMPDPESKKRAWDNIQRGDKAKLSQKEMEATIYGFTQSDQPQLTAKYYNSFFSTLHDYYTKSSYELFKTYLFSIMPRKGEITAEMLNKLHTYIDTKPKDDTKKEGTNGQQSISHNGSDSDGTVDEKNKAFQKLIEESIELLERQKKIRELAMKEAKM